VGFVVDKGALGQTSLSFQQCTGNVILSGFPTWIVTAMNVAVKKVGTKDSLIYYMGGTFRHIVLLLFKVTFYKHLCSNTSECCHYLHKAIYIYKKANVSIICTFLCCQIVPVTYIFINFADVNTTMSHKGKS
jgi:hypothetical protein